MTDRADAIMSVALEQLYGDEQHQSELLALTRSAVELMVRCEEARISWAQVLVEADNCVDEFNLQKPEGVPPFEGDRGRGLGRSIGPSAASGEWSWRVSPETVRWYLRGQTRLAQLSDVELGKTLDFWFGRDESVGDAIEHVIGVAVDSALHP
jgi:hypothetical protein